MINYVMLAVVLGSVLYTIGVANHGWTSPLDIARRAAGHRLPGHEDAWSDGDDPADDQMSTPDVQGGPLRPPAVLRRPVGPQPLQALTSAQRSADPEAVIQGETRIAWVRRQLEAGQLTPGEIDDIGAEKFSVTPRQVRRWRAKIAGISPAPEE